jgi:hypothetical protein
MKMKMNENLSNKIMKRFYGVTGPVDEYKRSESNRIGNNAFMFLWSYLLISNFVAALFAFKYPEKTLWILISINILVGVFLIGGYIIFTSMQSHLTDNEVEKSQIISEKRKIIRSSIIIGFAFMIGFHLLTAFMDFVVDDINFVKNTIKLRLNF